MKSFQYERVNNMYYITCDNRVAIIDCQERLAMGYIKLIIYNLDTCKDEIIIDYDGVTDNSWKWPEIKMVWDIIKRYFRTDSTWIE